MTILRLRFYSDFISLEVAYASDDLVRQAELVRLMLDRPDVPEKELNRIYFIAGALGFYHQYSEFDYVEYFGESDRRRIPSKSVRRCLLDTYIKIEKSMS